MLTLRYRCIEGPGLRRASCLHSSSEKGMNDHEEMRKIPPHELWRASRESNSDDGLSRDGTPKAHVVEFAHLFMTSFIPFSTAWIADTRLAAGRSFSMQRYSYDQHSFLGYQQEAYSGEWW